ncbi:MAG: amidohydrolase family protein [Proteobacteria bacterium]|nr:amidohydrolase family protein [Pseudomonadota bacterium]
MRAGLLITVLAVLLLGGMAHGAPARKPVRPPPAVADLIFTDARIYTAAGPAPAEALAVRGGRLIYVGSAAGAAAFIGPHTRVHRLHGRLIVPGLVDAHIHPLDIVDLDVCDLDSRELSLREVAESVRQCLRRYHPAPGKWLRVHQWNPYANSPDPEHPSLRAALDLAAPRNPVELMGNDGHKGAYNSAALSLARDRSGKVIGFSSRTLAGPFASFRPLVGVDEHGEPNGEVNEEARATFGTSTTYNDLEKVLEAPQRIAARLNAAGITAVLDAMAAPEGLPVYDKLYASGQMTFRATLAQYYDPSHTRTAAGKVDYERLVRAAVKVRARYADHPLIRADFVKLFADGVAEGNPFAVPPTLGNAAMVDAYLQPIFAKDAAGHATVTGYVNTASDVCTEVREHPASYAPATAVAAFMAANGYHPGQCALSNGVLQHEREIELEYVRRMHLAGFNLHIHVIGDRALRTALDAIEAARAADGVMTRDSLAHVQLTRPEDVVRTGQDHLYLAYTYSWALNRLDYDMTLIPFLQHVSGNDNASRHVAGSAYEENTYPFRTSKDAGAVLVAGSDAPVDTRDPRPFVNMAVAVTRRAGADAEAFNPRQAIRIREVLDAYTINGARMLGRDQDFGSLEAGKSADFVVLDRDILALADEGRADEVGGTRVLETWFQGRQVFGPPAH